MRLTKESLEFAKNHIKHFFDSDFFSKPVEYDALFNNWEETSEFLTEKEIIDYQIKTPFQMAVKKPNGGYRIVHQLDPINTLIYTAISYIVATSIENSRPKIEDKIACSYRIQLNLEKGHFFSNGTGWNDFLEKNLDLKEKYNYVLVTDITDFYNQIYLHRLQNAIDICYQNDGNASKQIEKFISGLNSKASKGIPVGPSASIILAEAILLDIDDFIESNNLEHTRYVDDINIYGNNLIELEMILSKLTQYLYDSHRLTLSGAKTYITESENYISSKLQNPEVLEDQAIFKQLTEIGKSISIQLDEELDDESVEFSLYSDFDETGEDEEEFEVPALEDLSGSEQVKVKISALIDLLNNIIDKGQINNLNYSLLRHILRRAKSLRIRGIVPFLFNDFDLFMPVLRDVFLYLNKVTNAKVIEHNISKIEEIILNSTYKEHDFFKYWFSLYFSKYPEFYQYPFVKKFLNSCSIRNFAVFAKNNSITHWIREKKNSIDNYGFWDKRAIIYATSALSKDERNSWLDHYEKTTTDFVELMLIKYVRSI